MHLVSRSAETNDFESVYPCTQAGNGGQRHVKAEWRLFRENPHAVAIIVEDVDRQRPHQVVGYCEGVFLARDFVEWVKSCQVPNVNGHIYERFKAGRSPLLSEEQIRTDNSADGLHLFIAHYGCSEASLTVTEAFHVRSFLSEALLNAYLGYNLAEIVVEVVGDACLRRANNAGFILRTDFACYATDGNPLNVNLRPYLLSLTRAEALQNDGSLLARAFCYRAPRFGFKPRDQAVLRLALEGCADHEIAASMLRTVSGIKKRWLAMYDRVAEEMPGLLPPQRDSVRGAEKRRLLLAYLRNHPEELRLQDHRTSAA